MWQNKKRKGEQEEYEFQKKRLYDEEQPTFMGNIN